MNQPPFLRCLVTAAAVAALVALSSCSTSSSPSVLSATGESYASQNTLRATSRARAPLAPSPVMNDPEIQSRPGLGTTAGSEQYSRFQSARFLRRSSTPDAVDSFHYNDEPGAKAMAQVIGGKVAKHSGLFAAAGDRLKVGLVRYREPFPHYEAGGRRIVVGQVGSHYEVRLENRSGKRLEVVLSVDGVNVLTGKPASPAQRGVVLDPKETYDVSGFRKDSNTVRTFQFGSVAASQAAKNGGANNVGIIGLAVFEEDEARVKAELQHEQEARGKANAFPGQ